MGLGDELPFTVDAGVGTLAGNLLLLLGDAARRRGRPTCVQGTWDSLKGWMEVEEQGAAERGMEEWSAKKKEKNQRTKRRN